MSRLLFAAARGARIEDDGVGAWSESRFVHLIGSDWEWRIHPDDAHLQYGPVSTALRDCDGDFQWNQIDWDDMPNLAIESAIVAGYANNMMQEWRQNKDRLTRSLFLLILAEALADEGM
tara:strand:+ start:484 stop:840 length:357 start_codon:yes stop_codon:yes gene_type:complete